VPRSLPPAPIGPIELDSYAVKLDARAQLDIARTLGSGALPCDVRGMLEGAIRNYRACAPAAKETTRAAVIAAIDEAQGTGKRFAKALAQFTDERSAVDGESFEILNPSARECLAALERFKSNANAVRERLRKYPRVNTPRRAAAFLRLVAADLLLRDTQSRKKFQHAGENAQIRAGCFRCNGARPR